MAATTAGGEVVTVSHMFDAGHRNTGSRGHGPLPDLQGSLWDVEKICGKTIDKARSVNCVMKVFLGGYIFMGKL